MTKTFTQDDVIRYLYEEIPEKEKSQFENALTCNEELVDLFHELNAVKHSLDKAQIHPSESVVQNILDYSKSFNLQSLK